MIESAKGKVAFVAGAGGGIGLGIATALIERGASVVLADVKPMPDTLPDGPGSCVYRQGDLTDAAFVEAGISEAARMFGRLDWLVNAHAVLDFANDTSFAAMDMDTWDRVFAVNLTSYALTARHAVAAMRKNRSGAMVHFSSIDALAGDPKPQDAYAISKAGVLRLSKSIAVQCAAERIRSNVILPGPTLTPMQDRWQGKPQVQKHVADSIPLGRLGAVDDHVNAALFLLSDKASWVTGSELVVDGGITAGR